MSARDEREAVHQEAQELSVRLVELSDDLLSFARALAEFNQAQTKPAEDD